MKEYIVFTVIRKQLQGHVVRSIVSVSATVCNNPLIGIRTVSAGNEETDIYSLVSHYRLSCF